MSNATRFVSPASQEVFSNVPTNSVGGDPNRPFNQRSGFYLVRLLNSKAVDPAAKLFVGNEVARWSDNTEITFGDLMVKSNVRPDGSSGTHYPNVFGLTHAEGSAAIDYCNGLPDKSSSNSYRPKAKNNPAPQQPPVAAPAEIDIAELVRQQVAAALGNIVPQAEPAPALPEFKSGDVIMVNGVAVQISADGKRLNKTIV